MSNLYRAKLPACFRRLPGSVLKRLTVSWPVTRSLIGSYRFVPPSPRRSKDWRAVQ